MGWLIRYPELALWVNIEANIEANLCFEYLWSYVIFLSVAWYISTINRVLSYTVLELRLKCDIGVLKLWLIFLNILNGYSINN